MQITFIGTRFNGYTHSLVFDMFRRVRCIRKLHLYGVTFCSLAEFGRILFSLPFIDHLTLKAGKQIQD